MQSCKVGDENEWPIAANRAFHRAIWAILLLMLTLTFDLIVDVELAKVMQMAAPAGSAGSPLVSSKRIVRVQTVKSNYA